MKKSPAQTFGGQYKIGVFQLQNLRPHHSGQTHPARQADHHSQTKNIGASKNGLQKDREKKARYAQYNIRQPHKNAVYPGRPITANASHQNADNRRNKSGSKPDKQRNPAAVPDHGKYVPPHGVRAEKKFPAGGNVPPCQIHIRRVFCHK